MGIKFIKNIKYVIGVPGFTKIIENFNENNKKITRNIIDIMNVKFDSFLISFIILFFVLRSMQL